MMDEINKIIDADEAAWEKVQAARVEADGMRSHALLRADELASEKRRELLTLIDAERQRILGEAHHQDPRTDSATDEPSLMFDSCY